ncbi:hypothetical protein AAG906_039815 [Vitis piasezkii]
MLDPILTKPWHYLSAWFQNDDPTPFHTAHERSFWDYAGHEPQLNNSFNEAMASDARLLTSAIANAFPHLNRTVLDLPTWLLALQGSKNLNYFADAILLKVYPNFHLSVT